MKILCVELKKEIEVKDQQDSSKSNTTIKYYSFLTDKVDEDQSSKLS